MGDAATRIPVSMRLPVEVVREVERYAVETGVRKTDAFLHFINLGIEHSHKDRGSISNLDVIERLDEILAYVKKPNNAAQSENTLEQSRRAIAEAALLYPAIEKAFVFGSVARGDEGPTSDLDLRLVIDRTKRFNLHDLEHFCKAIEQKTGRSVDAVTSDTLKNKNLAAAIEKDKVLVYERKKH